MASILIPPEKSAELPTKEEQQLALWADNGPAGLDLTPHLLLQLEDDLERSRLREAFWISVVVHLLVVIFIAMSPKIFGYKGIDLATTQQIVFKVLLPEALPGIMAGLTITFVSLTGYSAMAGAIGGGGLGDLGIRYGYQRFLPEVMAAVVLVLILFVQAVQSLGDWLVRRLSHK